MAIALETRQKVNFGKPKSFEDVLKKKGWTQIQAADRADLAFNTYVNIEQAQPTVNPTADNLIKLAEAFGVKVFDLWLERKIVF